MREVVLRAQWPSALQLETGEPEIGPDDLLVIPVTTRFSYVGIGEARMALFQTPPYDADAEVLDE